MSQVVVLKLGAGNWQLGFPLVLVQHWEAEESVPVQLSGSLPPAPHLAARYGQWRSLYTALSSRFVSRRATRGKSGIEIDDDDITNVSQAAFQDLCAQLKQDFNRWLETAAFSKIERRLRTRLSAQAEVRVIVETEDPDLRRFPWHLWTFFEDYAQAEVALSAPEYGQAGMRRSGDLRILAVLGNSEGIDVGRDRQFLEHLPHTHTTFLVEPQRRDLDQELWDEQGWDVFFFAGHSTSQSDAATGSIAVNPADTLGVAQLRNALATAIARGLQLAIFNSCDGLGLARDLADLNLPQLIVMREPVPDPVAQEFLKHWLNAFFRGKSFYSAVREARERLQGLEDQFPCASWLPVICQNPAEPPLVLRTGSRPAPPVQDPIPPLFPAPPLPRSPAPPLPLLLTAPLLITLLVVVARLLGFFQTWELSAFDQMMRSRPAEAPDSRLLVVEVTESDTHQYGYPLEDQTLATAVAKLQAMRPRAIALDFHRFQARGQGRAAFLEQFQQQDNLFLVCSFGSSDRNYAPPPEFSPQQRIAQMGFSELLIDRKQNPGSNFRYDLAVPGQAGNSEVMVRRQLLSYDPSLATSASACTTPYSLAFQLAFRWLYAAGVQPLEVNANQDWQFGPVSLTKLPARFGGYPFLDGQSSQIMINYRAAPPGAEVSLQQVLQGQVNPVLVKDRIVLLGTTAPIARDSFDTPYGEMPGVWVHAHAVSQILSAVHQNRPLIGGLPQTSGIPWGDGLWILLWAGGGMAIGWKLRSPLVLWIGGAIASLLLTSLCFILLLQGAWVPLIPSLLSLWLTSGTVRLFHSRLENRHVPPSS